MMKLETSRGGAVQVEVETVDAAGATMGRSVVEARSPHHAIMEELPMNTMKVTWGDRLGRRVADIELLDGTRYAVFARKAE